MTTQPEPIPDTARGAFYANRLRSVCRCDTISQEPAHGVNTFTTLTDALAAYILLQACLAVSPLPPGWRLEVARYDDDLHCVAVLSREGRRVALI